MSFLTVLALPKASRMGFACSSCFSSSPWWRGDGIRAWCGDQECFMLTLSWALVKQAQLSKSCVFLQRCIAFIGRYKHKTTHSMSASYTIQAGCLSYLRRCSHSPSNPPPPHPPPPSHTHTQKTKAAHYNTFPRHSKPTGAKTPVRPSLSMQAQTRGHKKLTGRLGKITQRKCGSALQHPRPIHTAA